MFDPTVYFGTVKRILAGCSEWATGDDPHLKVEFDPHKKWSIIIWRYEAVLSNGCRIVAFESHSWRQGKHYRKMKYRLMQANGDLIFQIDPHQHPIPFDHTPHLHVGPNQDYRLEDGAWELDGYSLKEFDFIKFWALVQSHVEDGSVPWRTVTI
ncbi:MAG: hypothetical protein J0G35_04175 [Acidobacteriales bacterium]|nr:hypothetical protein [Terriglobales bacterium]